MGFSVLPMAVSAVSASAQVSCSATALDGAVGGGQVRIPIQAPGVNNFNCVLGLGNAGNPVSTLQTALNKCNLHAGLTVDGDYGANTRQAVINVQAHFHLSQDGVYGPQTGTSITWPIAGSSPTICRKFRV
jgi:serine/threonine-protein kinase